MRPYLYGDLQRGCERSIKGMGLMAGCWLDVWGSFPRVLGLVGLQTLFDSLRLLRLVLLRCGAAGL